MQAKDLIVTGASRLLGKLKCLGDISASGKVTATNGFEGNVVGNVSGSAGTAGAFTSAKSVTLTGDVTGSASSTGGWSIATTVVDDSHNHTADTIMVPKITKSYTGVIASANNHDNAALYCIKIVPNSYTGQWYLKYRVFANMDGVSDANGHGYEESYVYINGMRNTYASYRTWNNVLHTSYRPYYYHSIYRAKEAGATTYGHVMGINLYNSYNPTNTTYKRNVTFEILDYGGCTISFLDAPTKYANIPGTGSTNYDGRTDFDGSTQGNSMSGDRNTTTTYGYIDYYFKPYAGQALYRYKFVLQGEDNRIYPIVTTNQTDGTQVAKVPTTVGLRPWKIWFYNSTTTINAGAVVGNQTMLPATYSTGAAYSFNTSIAAYNMVYLRGTYDKDKDLFYLYNDGSSPCTSYYTVVPDNTANITLSNYFVSGYYYLLLGATYSSANYINLFNVNSLHYFDGTNLKEVNRITPDWDENDSTSPSYIENRTHYRTSIGNVERATIEASDWSNTSNTMYGVTYNRYAAEMNTISGISQFFNKYGILQRAIVEGASTVPASIIINGTTTNHTLTVDYVESDYSSIYYLYDSTIVIGFEYSSFVDENGNDLPCMYITMVYAVNTLGISDNDTIVTINIEYPIIEEQFEYYKLNDNYLNGKLIRYGKGFNGEVFNSIMNVASGYASHAEGSYTTASGSNSHAEGDCTTAIGNDAHSEGYYTIASNNYSHAEGCYTVASGIYSHAEGRGHTDYVSVSLTGTANSVYYTVTNTPTLSLNQQYRLLTGKIYFWNEDNKYVSVDIVNSSIDTSNGLTSITVSKTLSTSAITSKSYLIELHATAGGVGSHAEGCNGFASGDYSHVEGSYAFAEGASAHAEGYRTIATGGSSHAEGYETVASGANSHSEGNGSSASGHYSHSEGRQTTASGESSHAEGYGSNASGNYSHAEGLSTGANKPYSHAEGNSTFADGVGAHAEGNSSSAYGNYSHAEGSSTTARGDYSHSEGYYTTASNGGAHAEGSNTTASGDYSHAEGYGTIASGNYSHAEGYSATSVGSSSHAEAYSYSKGIASHAEGGQPSTTITQSSKSIYLTGEANATTYTVNSYSLYGERTNLVGFKLYNSDIVINSQTVTNGVITSITLNKTLSSSAISNKSYVFKGGSSALGNNSHAEGEYTSAYGVDSHAEGFLTTAVGSNSHSEGSHTTASGDSSHAEGGSTTASGQNSHAEGGSTTASGQNSHVEGFGTTAQRRSQHVFGEYNTLDTGGSSVTTKGTYIEIVGKGTSDSARSNARTLDWSGNETLAGSITIGKGTSDEVTLTPAKLKQLLALL